MIARKLQLQQWLKLSSSSSSSGSVFLLISNQAVLRSHSEHLQPDSEYNSNGHWRRVEVVFSTWNSWRALTETGDFSGDFCYGDQ